MATPYVGNVLKFPKSEHFGFQSSERGKHSQSMSKTLLLFSNLVFFELLLIKTWTYLSSRCCWGEGGARPWTCHRFTAGPNKDKKLRKKPSTLWIVGTLAWWERASWAGREPTQLHPRSCFSASMYLLSHWFSSYPCFLSPAKSIWGCFFCGRHVDMSRQVKSQV